MNKIFVSYRRQDSVQYAGRLSDLLANHLGDSVVFMDLDGISPGEDFVQKIAEQLSACSVFLAVIGPQWLRVRRGLRRRLFLPNDFVRLEILAALKRKIEIIPVLVGGATMPPANLLPKSIAALAVRNGVQVTDNRFREDVAGLATVIKTRVIDGVEFAEDALQAERERVTRIIETDIGETQRRYKAKVTALLASAVLAFAIASAAWVASLRSPVAPHFAQASLTPDAHTFRVEHPDDTETWRMLYERGYMSRPQTFSRSRGGTEPILKLSDVLGSSGPEAVAAIEKSGHIVFHAVGSTGDVSGPRNTQLVADWMVKDFDGRSTGAPQPSFLFLLGDMILNFGEAKYYYDQFYSPYRNYPAPILAIAGNHDGSVEMGSTTRPLDAFLANFCTEPFHKSPDALELERTAQIQPGVYFTFETPFVRILALYSNVFEGPGILSNEGGAFPELSDAQLKFLEAAFTRIKSESFKGAVIIAVHHDPFGAGIHSGSPTMLSELDKISAQTGVWPHVVLSAHSHNYQRFTRRVNQTSIEYIVAGTGGARVTRLRPTKFTSPEIDLRYSDAEHFGFLRLIADHKRLRLEFQAVTDNTSTTNDAFNLDLATRSLVP